MRKIGITTTYREHLSRKIIETAMPLFKEKGIKAVKMDDIANEMGISKRTLYELYSKKEDLLFACLKYDSDEKNQKIGEYAKTQENEMNVITYALKLRFNDLTTTNTRFFVDIHKYSKIVEFLQSSKEELREHTSTFVQRCIEHGYFRDDLNYDIVDRMGEAAMNYVMESKIYQKYTWKEIFYTFINLHLKGCCTEKGSKFFDDLVKSFVDNNE